MKRHEEEKILALLNYLEYSEEDSERIINLIDNQNRDGEDLIDLMYKIENGLED